MELITIILYSLLILVVALVVFIGISYVAASIKKSNDRKRVIEHSHYQPIPQNYSTPVVDNIHIRREVDSYYERENIEQYQPEPKIIRRSEKRRPKPRAVRYNVVNQNTFFETGGSSLSIRKNYNSLDLNDLFKSYEDEDNGIYYNIKIGA